MDFNGCRTENGILHYSLRYFNLKCLHFKNFCFSSQSHFYYIVLVFCLSLFPKNSNFKYTSAALLTDSRTLAGPSDGKSNVHPVIACKPLTSHRDKHETIYSTKCCSAQLLLLFFIVIILKVRTERSLGDALHCLLRLAASFSSLFCSVFFTVPVSLQILIKAGFLYWIHR